MPKQIDVFKKEGEGEQSGGGQEKHGQPPVVHRRQQQHQQHRQQGGRHQHPVFRAVQPHPRLENLPVTAGPAEAGGGLDVEEGRQGHRGAEQEGGHRGPAESPGSLPAFFPGQHQQKIQSAHHQQEKKDHKGEIQILYETEGQGA